MTGVTIHNFSWRAKVLCSAALTLLLVTACTNKKVSRTKHRSPVEVVYQYSAQIGPDERKQAMDALDPVEAEVKSLVETYQSQARTAGDDTSARLSGEASSRLLQLLVAPQDVGLAEPVSLEITALSNSFIKAPEISIETYNDQLEAFNLGFFLLLKQGESSEELEQLKDRYHESLHYGCQPGSLDGCLHLERLRGDHLTALILLELVNSRQERMDVQQAEIEEYMNQHPGCSTDSACTEELNRRSAEFYENVREFYRGLATVFEMKNTQPNLELILKYVKYSQYYNNWISTLTDSAQRGELIRRHRNRLGVALTQIRDQKAKNPAAFESYCQYLTSSRPYTIEFLQVFSSDRANLRGYFNEYLACSTRGGRGESKFAEDFSNYVEQWKNQVLAEYQEVRNAGEDVMTRRPGGDLSYFQALEELKRTPYMLKNLSVQDSFAIESSVFYAVEMFYYGYIDAEIARTLLNQTRSEMTSTSERIAFDKKVLEFIRHYIQIQTLFTLRDTYITLSDLFEEEFARTTGLASGTFAEVVRKLNNLTDTNWTQLKVKSSLMLGLVESTFDSSYRFPRQGTEVVADLYKTLRAVLSKDTMNTNFDYLATMPVMYALAYYMSKAQGNIQVHIPWIARSDTYFSSVAEEALTSTVLQDNNSVFRPVRYGNTVFAFNDMQKFHALDMALRSGLFELFPLGMLMEDQARIDALKSEYGDTLGQVDDPRFFNEYLFFYQFIEDWLMTGEKSLTETITRLEEIENDPAFKDNFLQICENPLEAFVQFEHGTLASRTLLDSTYISSVLAEVYEKPVSAVNGLRYRFEYIEELMRLLREYFERAQGISPEKKAHYDKLIAGIRSEVESMKTRERTIWRKVFQLDRQIVGNRGNCIERIFRAELFRQNYLYSENIEFYKNVHAAMTLLRLPEAQHEEVSKAGLLEAVAAWASSAASEAPAGYDAQAWQQTVNDVHTRAVAVIADIFDTGLIDKTKANPGQSRLNAAVNDLFGIHNRYQPPYFGHESQVGYLVYDLEDADETGNVVKRLNQISGDEFFQGKWDTLIRLRTQLKELRVDAQLAEEFIGEIPGYGNQPGESKEIGLGENVVIELGSISELERQTFYRDNKKHRLTYSTDPAVFVSEAMKQFGGEVSGGGQYVSWHNQFRNGISEVNYRKKMLQTALRHDVIQTADTDPTVCSRDIWGDVQPAKPWQELKFSSAQSDQCQALRVTARDVIEEFISYVQYMKVNEALDKALPTSAELADSLEKSWEANLLVLLNRETRMGGVAESWFKYNDLRNSQDWTWFDQWYRSNLSSFRARNANYQTVEVDYIEGALDFTHIYKYTLETKMGKTLIELNPSVNQIIRDRYREQIVRHIGLLDEGRAYIRFLENSQKESTRSDLGPIVFQRVKQARQGESYIQALGERWRYVNVRPRTSGERAGTPILFLDEEGAERWSENYILTFMVDKAGCQALPRNPQDPDYALYRDALAQADTSKCRSSLFPAWNLQRERLSGEQWDYSKILRTEVGAGE